VLLIYFLNLKVKSRIIYCIGILLGLIGIIISTLGFDISEVQVYLIKKYWYCYVLGIINSITWSYYSVFIVLEKNYISNLHIYICFILSGLISLGISFLLNEYKNYEQIQFDFIDMLKLFYSIMMVNILAYLFWNISYKNGYPLIVSNFSILAPFLSISFISLFYSVYFLNPNLYGSIFLIVCVIIFKFNTLSN
jgi:drug/metabolite transporter (DMT)-like permease